ncbi:Uu.00g034590.m01.CDS01 [Anthostomella pinea]|uniref:Uu.00g034590.m01.CDS01 n=1 Tax=Anthostomella pinea TaxID=933095 RepID=A0AAI8VA38_9PEZI|nr:Uu.00g034590.m01.CDS01 [Anthostomella pinea]
MDNPSPADGSGSQSPETTPLPEYYLAQAVPRGMGLGIIRPCPPGMNPREAVYYGVSKTLSHMVAIKPSIAHQQSQHAHRDDQHGLDGPAAPVIPEYDTIRSGSGIAFVAVDRLADNPYFESPIYWCIPHWTMCCPGVLAESKRYLNGRLEDPDVRSQQAEWERCIQSGSFPAPSKAITKHAKTPLLEQPSGQALWRLWGATTELPAFPAFEDYQVTQTLQQALDTYRTELPDDFLTDGQVKAAVFAWYHFRTRHVSDEEMKAEEVPLTQFIPYLIEMLKRVETFGWAFYADVDRFAIYCLHHGESMNGTRLRLDQPFIDEYLVAGELRKLRPQMAGLFFPCDLRGSTIPSFGNVDIHPMGWFNRRTTQTRLEPLEPLRECIGDIRSICWHDYELRDQVDLQRLKVLLSREDWDSWRPSLEQHGKDLDVDALQSETQSEGGQLHLVNAEKILKSLTLWTRETQLKELISDHDKRLRSLLSLQQKAQATLDEDMAYVPRDDDIREARFMYLRAEGNMRRYIKEQVEETNRQRASATSELILVQMQALEGSTLRGSTTAANSEAGTSRGTGPLSGSTGTEWEEASIKAGPKFRSVLVHVKRRSGLF